MNFRHIFCCGAEEYDLQRLLHFCDKQHNIIFFSAHGLPYYQERIPTGVKIALRSRVTLYYITSELTLSDLFR